MVKALDRRSPIVKGFKSKKASYSRLAWFGRMTGWILFHRAQMGLGSAIRVKRVALVVLFVENLPWAARNGALDVIGDKLD